MDETLKKQLEITACKVRLGILEGVFNAKSGHPGGSLSIADLLTYLYFAKMNVYPDKPEEPERDRLVLSKGHTAPALYATLAEKGFFPKDELKSLRHIGAMLQGHPCISIPGMVVINPADDVEAKAAVEAAILHEGPVYLRFGRLATPIFNDPETYKFELGKGVKLRDGKDIAIVATGLMVYEAIEAAKALAAEGIEATVINIHTIKPIDEDIIVEAAKNTGLLLTVEEHSVIGGLGSAVADVLAARHPAKLVKIGVNDEFGHSGPAVDLLKEYGLCADNIVAKARDAVKAK